MTLTSWTLAYIVVGLLLAFALATQTLTGRRKDWGWGPALMVVVGWLPLIILLILLPERFKR